jgi:hypothetical protein
MNSKRVYKGLSVSLRTERALVTECAMDNWNEDLKKAFDIVRYT